MLLPTAEIAPPAKAPAVATVLETVGARASDIFPSTQSVAIVAYWRRFLLGAQLGWFPAGLLSGLRGSVSNVLLLRRVVGLWWLATGGQLLTLERSWCRKGVGWNLFGGKFWCSPDFPLRLCLRSYPAPGRGDVDEVLVEEDIK